MLFYIDERCAFQVKNAIQALQELATTSSNVRYPYSLPARSNPDLPENVKRPHTAMLQRSSSHPPEVFGWDGAYDSPTHHQSYNVHHTPFHHNQHQQQHQAYQHHHQYHQQHHNAQPQPQPQQLQLQYYHRSFSVTSTVDAAAQTDISGVDVFERFVKTHRSLVLEWLNESDHVAVTVYDEEIVVATVDFGGDGGAGRGDRRRNERSPPPSSSLSSTCSSSSPTSHGERAENSTTVQEEDPAPPPPHDVCDWYPGTSKGAQANDTSNDDEEVTEAIEMSHITPTTTTPADSNAATATTIDATVPKNQKYHPFV